MKLGGLQLGEAVNCFWLLFIFLAVLSEIAQAKRTSGCARLTQSVTLNLTCNSGQHISIDDVLAGDRAADCRVNRSAECSVTSTNITQLPQVIACKGLGSCNVSVNFAITCGTKPLSLYAVEILYWCLEQSTMPQTESMTRSTISTRESVTGSTMSSRESVTGSTMSSTESLTGSTMSPTEPLTGSTMSPAEPLTGSTMSPTESVTGSTMSSTEPLAGSTMSPTESVTGSTMSPTESVTGSTMSPTEVMRETAMSTTETTTGSQSKASVPGVVLMVMSVLLGVVVIMTLMAVCFLCVYRKHRKGGESSRDFPSTTKHLDHVRAPANANQYSAMISGNVCVNVVPMSRLENTEQITDDGYWQLGPTDVLVPIAVQNSVFGAREGDSPVQNSVSQWDSLVQNSVSQGDSVYAQLEVPSGGRGSTDYCEVEVGVEDSITVVRVQSDVNCDEVMLPEQSLQNSPHINVAAPPTDHLDGACVDGACVDGACVDDACVDGAYVDDACVDGACVDGACVDGACVDGACVDGACVDGAYVDSVCVDAADCGEQLEQRNEVNEQHRIPGHDSAPSKMGVAESDPRGTGALHAKIADGSSTHKPISNYDHLVIKPTEGIYTPLEKQELNVQADTQRKNKNYYFEIEPQHLKHERDVDFDKTRNKSKTTDSPYNHLSLSTNEQLVDFTTDRDLQKQGERSTSPHSCPGEHVAMKEAEENSKDGHDTREPTQRNNKHDYFELEPRRFTHDIDANVTTLHENISEYIKHTTDDTSEIETESPYDHLKSNNKHVSTELLDIIAHDISPPEVGVSQTTVTDGSGCRDHTLVIYDHLTSQHPTPRTNQHNVEQSLPRQTEERADEDYRDALDQRKTETTRKGKGEDFVSLELREDTVGHTQLTDGDESLDDQNVGYGGAGKEHDRNGVYAGAGDGNGVYAGAGDGNVGYGGADKENDGNGVYAGAGDGNVGYGGADKEHDGNGVYAGAVDRNVGYGGPDTGDYRDERAVDQNEPQSLFDCLDTKL